MNREHHALRLGGLIPALFVIAAPKNQPLKTWRLSYS